MTGKELLNLLQAMPEENLNLPVRLCSTEWLAELLSVLVPRDHNEPCIRLED